MPSTTVIALAMIGTGVLLGVFVIVQAVRYKKREKEAKLPLDQ